MKEANENNKTETDMKEIKLSIPDGCTSVTVKVDGENVMTEFELQEEWKPKDGDVVYAQWGGNRSGYKWIFIYKEANTDPYSHCDVYAYLGIERDGKPVSELHFDDYCNTQDLLRPATDEEKQRLFDALAKAGKRWNAEEKRVEDLPRWRAPYGGYYYYICSDFTIDHQSDVSHHFDDERYSVGNYFRTREAAERVTAQIREIFKNSKAE